MLERLSRLRRKLSRVPKRPGVYKLLDGRGKTLYVGKARDLRARLRSYLAGPDQLPLRIRMLMERVEDFEVLVTQSEREALILEADLVRQFKPHFNVRLKDDKSFPYLKITLSEPFPRMELTRRVEEDGDLYFGPFVSAGKLRHTMEFIGRVFQLRTCRLVIDEHHTYERPCLDFHLGRCPAPCIGAISEADYRRLVEEAVSFLRGERVDVIRRIEGEMQAAARRREFERAARLRDLLFALRQTIADARQGKGQFVSLDAMGLAYREGEALVMIQPVRGGRYLGERAVRLSASLDESPAEILAAFIKLYYSNPLNLPREIALPEEPEDRELLAQWLSELAGRKVRLTVPRRGQKRRLVEQAAANARQRFLTLYAPAQSPAGVFTPAQIRLAKLLELPAPPARIEGYDVAVLHGKEPVGAMVVFEGGEPSPREYRTFNLKGSARDDFGLMAELMERRLRRLISDPQWEREIDLMVIDGGPGQLSAVLEVFERLTQEASHLRPILEGIAVVALAKKAETVYLPPREGELFRQLNLSRRDPALALLQRVRDEAHRVSNLRHRRRREREVRAGLLESVPGLGAVKARRLITHFGSPLAVARAGEEELMEVPGIGPELAARIRQHLAKASREEMKRSVRRARLVFEEGED